MATKMKKKQVMQKNIDFSANDLTVAFEQAEKHGIDTEIYFPDTITLDEKDILTRQGDIVTKTAVKTRWQRDKELSLDFIKTLMEQEIKPLKIKTPKIRKGREIAVFSIPDLHLGSLCSELRTGKNFDIKTARKLYIKAIDNILRRLDNMNVDKILFPLGQDYLNIDNVYQTTANHTPQPTDKTYPEILMAGMNLFLEAVEKLGEKYKVHIPVVQGNHDKNSVLAIALGVQARYADCKHITVDIDLKERQYFKEGKVLIGLDHGAHVPKIDKLVNLMANETGDWWSQCPHRFFYRSHLHHFQKYVVMLGKMQGSVNIEYLPSLRSPCPWSADNGFTTSPQQATVHVIDRVTGDATSMTYNVQPADIKVQ